MRPLEFGWYLPTHGDTTAYGLMEAQIPGSPELCERVVQAAEAAGFEYLLIPFGSRGRTRARSRPKACATPRKNATH